MVDALSKGCAWPWEVGPPQKLAVVQHLIRELFDAFKYRPLKRRQGRVRKQNGSYGLDLPGIVRPQLYD